MLCPCLVRVTTAQRVARAPFCGRSGSGQPCPAGLFPPGPRGFRERRGGVQAASSRARLTPVDWSTVTPFCTVQAYTASDTCLRERPLESLAHGDDAEASAAFRQHRKVISRTPILAGNGWPAPAAGPISVDVPLRPGLRFKAGSERGSTG
jgi:hypothetical protein